MVIPENLEQKSSNSVLSLSKYLSIPWVPCNPLLCWLMLCDVRTDRVMHHYFLACFCSQQLPCRWHHFWPFGLINLTSAIKEFDRCESDRHGTDCQQRWWLLVKHPRMVPNVLNLIRFALASATTGDRFRRGSS